MPILLLFALFYKNAYINALSIILQAISILLLFLLLKGKALVMLFVILQAMLILLLSLLFHRKCYINALCVIVIVDIGKKTTQPIYIKTFPYIL